MNFADCFGITIYAFSPKYHLEKLNAVESIGYRLITVFEDEWDYTPDIVKSRIRVILNHDKSYIGARKTKVKEVNTKEAKEFITKYHIQGYANASVKLGLYYLDKLVAIMTFSKPSKAKGGKMKAGTWELSRFCSSARVIGGASKLLSYFTKIYVPTEIFSYADRRWSTGEVYQKLGFKHSHDTRIGYWYISGNQRIHRFALRKQITDPKSITETNLRYSQGYLRIWDCGHSNWIWKPE